MSYARKLMKSINRLLFLLLLLLLPLIFFHEELLQNEKEKKIIEHTFIHHYYISAAYQTNESFTTRFSSCLISISNWFFFHFAIISARMCRPYFT